MIDDDNEMIVGKDRARLAEANADGSRYKLSICERCGWYGDGYGHASRCIPAHGRIASALAHEVPEANPTKLGYGPNRLTFELDDETHVRFTINSDGTIKLDELYALQNLTITQAAELVRAIKKALGK
jgi:hypothetical protein